MKKKIIIALSTLLVAMSITIFVFAYYNFFASKKGSEIVLENVKFQVNDSPNKGEEDVVYFTTDELTEGDGYQVNLKYSLNGTFVSNYAMKYSTYFEVEDESGISNAIDVYRFYDGSFHFVANLNSLLYSESDSEPVSVYTDFLGTSGSHLEKFILVYSLGSKIEDKSSFNLKISTKSEMVTTTAAEFPYFYLNDMGGSDDSQMAETAESIFKQLPDNELIYGRTIVLMKDLVYTTKTDITFNNLVGLDLNGHKIDLHGGTLTFKDTNETGTNNYNKSLSISDNVGGGFLKDSTIAINYSKSVIDIQNDFYTNSSKLNNSNINITSIGLNAFENASSQKFEEITDIKHTVTNGNYSFDLFGDLKFYLLKEYLSINNDGVSVLSSRGEAELNIDSNYIFNISGINSSDSISLTIPVSDSTSKVTINDILQLYGSTTDSCVEYLMSYIPKRLDGSIYLPSYISIFNAYITWISYDENLINNTGRVLPNGYFNLDSWVSKKTNLGFIIDQSGDVLSGVIKDIEIVVLSPEERAELLFDAISVTFNGDDVTSYSFDLVNSLFNKYDSNDLAAIASEYFNITLDSSKTFDEQKEDFIAELKVKLGLDHITVSSEQEPQFVKEGHDSSLQPLLSGVTDLTQDGTPNEIVSLVYSINYTFADAIVVKYKLFNINTGEAEVTLVDVTNSLRVPFDIYSEHITGYTMDGDYRIYNKYVNNFQLVSSFDGITIDYTVPNEYRNYVKIETNQQGQKILTITRDNVPADTHTVTIVARISGVDSPIYLPFTCVGVLHNVNSANHAEFEDGKLYIELLNKYDTNHDLTLTDLEAKNSPITSLVINGNNITSLKGLKYFNNLTSLDLKNNKIVNIDDLSYLPGLTKVDLGNNRITSIKALEYLDNLTEIYVSKNQISSIEPIQYLTKLEKVDISYNNIADFRYINNLTSLTELRVYENTISGKYTIDIETYGSNQSGMTEVIRSNQYYFNLLKFKDNGLKLYIKNKDTEYNFNAAQYALEANILSQIEPIYFTSDTIVLPTHINLNNTDYEITYFTNTYSDYIDITRNNNYSVTNIDLTQLPVDNKVIIYANTTGLAGAYFYRPLEFYIRKGHSDANNYGEIEVAAGHWVKASRLVNDTTLLASLWVAYDKNVDGKITNAELNPSTAVNLEFDSLGIKSLNGIQYFGNIQSLNLRSNDFEDLNNDGFADIKYLGYLQNLKTLYLSGQLFDFDELLNYTRLKNNSIYEDYLDETVTLKDINGVNFDVNLRHGLTTLNNLYVNGSLELNEYSQKTKLYHVYLTNPTLGTFTGSGNNKVSYGIYKDTYNEIWNPLTEEISKFLGSLATSAKFINYNDEIQIKKSYDIYLYDDLIPTTFNLASGTISSTEFMFAGGDVGKNPTSGEYVNIYDAGVTGNVLKAVDTAFLTKENYLLSSYFEIDASDLVNISIKYKRLVYKDYQSYLNMTLSADTISQGRKTLSEDDKNFNYYMTLFMQYNNDYVFSSEDEEADGKSINAIFGAIETMLFVSNSLSEELRTGLRGYNYTVTLNDGSIENHTSLETNPDVAINYTVTEDEVAEYTGAFDTVAAYDTSLYFFIHGNFMPTAKSAVDGLRFLPQLKKVYFRRDAVLGTGKDLINIEELFLVYSFLDIKDFNVVLPNMKILISAQGTGTNLSDETSLDSNPNNLIETYMVYLPNLIEFYMNGEGENGKGTMYEWSAFLAYSYIPFGQIYDYDETNKTITPTKYYSLDGANEKIGGVVLDDEKKYFWFDFSNDSYDNFKLVYYKSSTGFVALTQSILLANLSTIFANDGRVYTNLYGSPDGDRLAVTNQLFRHVRQGTVQLNNFKIQGKAQTYSNTYMNHVVLMELYKNLVEGTKTHYYLSKSANAGNSYDFDPSFSNIVFESNVTDEYDELAPTISNLHVKLTGKTFDGTVLDNTEYNDLDWLNSDYSDYFRQGLVVKLPTKFTDYLTGVPQIDKYRNFTISWYASYYIYSGSTQELQKTQVLLDTSNFTSGSVSYNSYFSNRSYTNNTLTFTLNYSGYYLFEGLLESSDGTSSYEYYTSFDKNFLLEHHKPAVYAVYPYLDQYNYMDKIKGSLSIIYPITISSMSENDISAYLSDGTKTLNRMTKICDDTLIMDYANKSITNPYNLKWFDTIIDRTFKFSIFLTYGAKNKGIDAKLEYDLSTQEDGYTAYNAFDRIVKYQLGIEASGTWLGPSTEISVNNPVGKVYKYTNKDKGINDKTLIKTFAGLRRLISEIFTLDGWETIKMTSFKYMTAMDISYIPKRIPVDLTSLKISTVQGMTYYGGIFESNIDTAWVDYKTFDINSSEYGISTKIATYDSLLDLYDYLDENSELKKLKELKCNMMTEESYVLLSKICSNSGIKQDKLTVYTSALSNKGIISFNNYNNVVTFLNNMQDNTSKLEIRPFNSFDLVEILTNLKTYYDDVTAPDPGTASKTKTYKNTLSLSSNYTITGPNGNVFEDKEYDTSDFIPDWNLGKENYNVQIQYSKDSKGVRLFKELDVTSNANLANQFDVKIATFKSTIGTNGIIYGDDKNNYNYSINDLNIYDTSDFDIEWVRFLISLLYSHNASNSVGKAGNIRIKDYSSDVVAMYGHQKHSGTNYSYGMGLTDPRSSLGYTLIFDKNLSKKDNDTSNDQTYYIIINTEYFSFEYADYVIGPRSFSYTTVDMKGWEKLPFTAVTIGAGRKNSSFTIKKIVNTSNESFTPKISYLGIGINWDKDYAGFKFQTVLEDISGLDKSLADNATVFLGSHVKLKSKFVKYDSNVGLTLNTTKNFNTSIESSKMHTLQYNGNYETSYDYMNLKKEIVKSIINVNPLIYKNYNDTMIAVHNNMISLCTGGMSNITMFTNNLNHPFVNDNSVLFYDSIYSYYIKNKEATGRVIYFGSKYDSSKLIGTLINMNSDRIRTLSNNNYISMLDNSSNGRVQVNSEIRYSLTEGATIKLPHYASDGVTSIVYYAVTTYNAGESVYLVQGSIHSQGNDYNSMGGKDGSLDMFVFKEYENYWEISLKEGHKLYMEMNYEFAIYKDRTSYINDGTYTNKQIFDKRKTDDKRGTFYVDVNYIPNIGHYVVKNDDPLYLPKTLTILGKECNLNYVVDSNYSNYFSIADNGTYYTYSLTNNAETVSNIKIRCTFNTTKFTYGSHSTTTEVQVYAGQWENGVTYHYIVTGWNTNQTGVLTEDYYNVIISNGGTIYKIVTETVSEFYDTTYTGSFVFFVNVSAGNSTNTLNSAKSYTASDYYVEVLIDSETENVVAGSLIYDGNGDYIDGDYVDSLGNPKSGYEWKIIKANEVFESGLLLTDMYYSGAISIGSTGYTTHKTVSATSFDNVDFFPRYVVVDYYGDFVYDGGNLITFANDQKGVAELAVSTGDYADLDYHLALIYTKNQIANIHYFSNTSDSGSVDFRAQSTLNGLEIFPLTHIRFGYYNNDFNWNGTNSRAFPGNTFKALKDMKLVEFDLVFKHTSIFVSDWTFLFNSRETLTNFMYGGIKTGHAETYGTTHDDFSFLLSFDNLEQVILYGLPGIQDTQSFKYFINMMYLKHNENIVRYFYNYNDGKFYEYTGLFTGISEDIVTASTILNSFDTAEQSNFNYQNGYELYLGDNSSYYSNVSNYDDTDVTTQYLLPSYINDSGTYYKLTYESLSNFANIVVIDKLGNELTMLQYQALYAEYVYDCLENNIEVDDYEFTKDYQIYVRFNNLINCLTDRIMISMKIESQSKMLSKPSILEIDNSSVESKTNYINGTGYPDTYYDGNTYIYTPYSYERFLSIYVDHTSNAYLN